MTHSRSRISEAPAAPPSGPPLPSRALAAAHPLAEATHRPSPRLPEASPLPPSSPRPPTARYRHRRAVRGRRRTIRPALLFLSSFPSRSLHLRLPFLAAGSAAAGPQLFQWRTRRLPRTRPPAASPPLSFPSPTPAVPPSASASTLALLRRPRRRPSRSSFPRYLLISTSFLLCFLVLLFFVIALKL